MHVLGTWWKLYMDIQCGYTATALFSVSLTCARITHYNDIMMSAMVCQIASLTIVYPTVYSGADQRKHQSSASLAFVCGEFTGDRWIPRTNGQWRGKCFHLMTSSRKRGMEHIGSFDNKSSFFTLFEITSVSQIHLVISWWYSTDEEEFEKHPWKSDTNGFFLFICRQWPCLFSDQVLLTHRGWDKMIVMLPWLQMTFSTNFFNKMFLFWFKFNRCLSLRFQLIPELMVTHSRDAYRNNCVTRPQRVNTLKTWTKWTTVCRRQI